jgi:hypothetical protein
MWCCGKKKTNKVGDNNNTDSVCVLVGGNDVKVKHEKDIAKEVGIHLAIDM